MLSVDFTRGLTRCRVRDGGPCNTGGSNGGCGGSSLTDAILKNVPDDLLHGLPEEDQLAILAAVGQRVTIVTGEDRSWPDTHLTEVEWEDEADGTIHTIWIEPSSLSQI